LLDLNLEFATAHMYLDLKPVRSLSDLASLDPTEVDDEALSELQVEDASGVKLILGSAAPQDAELVSVPLVQHGIDHLRAIADYVFVDTPAAFTQQVLAALDAADIVVVVTAAHLASVKAAKDWLNVLEKLSYPEERAVLVLNRTSQGGLDTEQVARFLDRRAAIVIPFTAVFDECADRGRPLVVLRPDNVAAKVMRDLAEHLTLVAVPGR
jgi:pilus assembly protein CpaE